MTTIIAHIPVSPGFRWIRHGLHKLVTPADGLARLEYKYRFSFTDTFGDGLRPFYHLPWGKWDAIPWFGGWTGMRLDARLLAQEHLDWLDERVCWILDYGPRHPLVYIGGTPPMSLHTARISNFTGIVADIAVDGLSAGEWTLLHKDIWKRHKAGQTVYTEANRICPSLTVSRLEDCVPCIATARNWRRGDDNPRRFWSIDHHPPGSLLWFPRGVRSGLDWETAERGVEAGMGLVVNLPRTDIERLKDLVE